MVYLWHGWFQKTANELSESPTVSSSAITPSNISTTSADASSVAMRREGGSHPSVYYAAPTRPKSLPIGKDLRFTSSAPTDAATTTAVSPSSPLVSSASLAQRFVTARLAALRSALNLAQRSNCLSLSTLFIV